MTSLTRTSRRQFLTAYKEGNYQLAYDHLTSIADDTTHYAGNRIRGKAMFRIYLLAQEKKIDLSDNYKNTLLENAAAFGCEEAIVEKNRVHPFYGM